METSDRQLIDEASRGDEPAIEALLRRHLPGIQGYLRHHASRLVGAKESSSDLVQSVCREVLVHLAEERFEYRGEAEFKQWLYGAALHKLRNRHRYWQAGKRDAAREAAVPEPPDPAGSVPTPSQDAMKKEQLERLREALEELPERDRDIVTLAHIENRGHDEIAARLGITAAHSRVLLSRALARLASRETPEG